MALTQGLVGWWQFTEGEGNIAHDYANGNNGTLVNNPTWTKAFNGAGALYFNANNYVSSPNQPTLGGTFTITFWFNIIQYPSTNNYVFPIFQRTSTIYLDVRFGSGNQGSLAWELYDGTNYYAFVYSGTPSINTWHFLSWVVDKTGKNAYTYLDGQLIGTTAITNLGNTNSGTNFVIGQPGSVNNNQILTDVRIYNYALSPSQINALYWNGPISYAKNYQVGVSTTYQSIPQYQNNSLNNQDLVFSTSQGGWNPVPTDGLVGYWPLDEMQGTIAHDFSGNNNHGTLINGPTWTTGYYNGALNFSVSSNQYVSVNNAITSLIGSSLTVTAWFYTTDFNNEPSNSYIVNGWDGGDNGFLFAICCQGNALLSFRTYTGGSGNIHEADSNIVVLSNNVWHFLVGTISGQQAAFYVDGQLINTFTTYAPFGSWPGPFDIGSNYIGGIIADVRLYNRALSQYEVLQLYSTSSVGHIVLNPSITDVTTQTIQNNLVSYYKFDEGVINTQPWATGNITYDSSGNANNGLNYNASYVTGKNGTAIQFTGTQGKYVNAPQSFATSSVTISAWIYPISASKLDDNIILSTNTFEVGYNKSLQPVAKLAGSGNTQIITGTSALTNNAWNNTVYLINISSTPSASVQFYKNNTSIGYSTFSWGLTTFSVSNVRIGANEGIFTNITSNEDASCSLDDLRIYNRALQPSEITFIYSSVNTFVGSINLSSSYITAPQFTTLTISTTSSPPNEQYIVGVIGTTNSGVNLISDANQTLLVTQAVPYTIGMAVYDRNQNTVSAFSIQQNQTFSFSLQIYPISITTYPNNVNLSLSLPLTDYGITGGISTTSVLAGFTQSNPKTIYFSITTSPTAPLTTSYVQIVATDASNPVIQAQAELSVSVVQIPSNQVSQSQSNAYTESIIPFLEVGRLSSYYNIGNSNAVWGSLWSGLVFAGTGTQGVIVGGSEPNVGYSATNMIDLGWGTGRSDPNAGKIIWGSSLDINSVNILGQGPTGQRKLHLWDNLLLNGKLTMIDNVTTQGNFGALTPIYSAYNIPVSSQNTVVLTFTPPYNGTYRVVATGHVSTVLNPMTTYLTYVNGITNTTVSMRFYNDDQTIDSPIIDVTINSAPVSAISIYSICISNVGYFDSVLVFGI